METALTIFDGVKKALRLLEDTKMFRKCDSVAEEIALLPALPTLDDEKT